MAFLLGSYMHIDHFRGRDGPGNDKSGGDVSDGRRHGPGASPAAGRPREEAALTNGLVTSYLRPARGK